MTPDLWFAGAAALLALGWLGYTVWPGSRRRISRRWISEHKVPITDELVVEVENARWRARVGMIVGVLAGLFAMVALTPRFSPEDHSWTSGSAMFAPFLVVVGFVAIGWSFGGLVARAPRLGTLRVAHSRATRLSDFVRPHVLMLARLEFLAVFGLLTAALIFDTWVGMGFGSHQSGGVWVMMIALLIAWTASELLAHRLARRPQPSTDPLSLFWRDAVRSEEISSIITGPGLVCYFAAITLSLASPAEGWSRHPAVILVALGVMVMNMVVQRLAEDRRRFAAHWGRTEVSLGQPVEAV